MIAPVVLEIIAFPVLYAVGFVIVKLMSLGRARILALSDRGYEKQMTWHQFFLRRSGIRVWTPEGVILVGACSTLLIGVAGFLLWSLT
ncbi:MAG TPA: hypothetical protein VGD88_00615 [Opitutaceae bacterium]